MPKMRGNPMRTLTLSLLLVALVATVGLGWLFDQLYDQYYDGEQTQNNDKTKDIEQLGMTLATTLNALPNRHEFVQKWQKERDSSAAPEETHQYSLSIIEAKDSPLPDHLLDTIRQGTPLLLETISHLTYHFYLPEHAELLVLKSVSEQSYGEEKSLNYIFTSLFYVALLLLFFMWAFPLVRQLLTLRQAAKSFGNGKLEQRINISSLSYIRDIELEFNHMAQRIEDLVGDVKLLSSAVSHDLRTPLARIRFGIDTLREENDPIMRRRYEEKISNNVDEMTSLVETLLAYSRLDQAMLELNKEKINLSQLIARCVEKLGSETNEMSFLRPQSDVYIHADKSYLVILVNNLLQNAINYGAGKVVIQLIAEQAEIKLTIDDNGKGVPVTQRESIFLPFIRGTESNGESNGHGVGLAIVKRIAEWHNGEVSVCSSDKLTGAQFTAVFPET